MTKKLFSMEHGSVTIDSSRDYKVEDVVDAEIVEETIIPKEPVKLDNDELFSNIKDIFNGDKTSTDNKLNDIYFIPGSSSNENSKVIDINDTILAPNKASLFQPNFLEKNYLKQLESMIFTKEEDVDVEKLLLLSYVTKLIITKKTPIQIKYKNVRLVSRICTILNLFYNKNYIILSSICTSLDSVDLEDKETGKLNTSNIDSQIEEERRKEEEQEENGE